MRKGKFGKQLTAAVMAATLLILPLAALAQTRIVAPKNKYKVQDDIKLGNDAARQVEQQMPIISDADAARYIDRVGQRLVASIPPEFQHSEFNYRFQWLNASDINAFALPGGPMFINRGMIEAAHNEGELAGVMAHELSHVALRHATAQATKASSTSSTLRNLGLILGGAVIGGQAGAQLGAGLAGTFMLKFSREYESQADTLGAQIMAKAGYDPHDLANVFKTIEGESKGSGPEWLSDHPNPGNRYENINREASYLRVSQDPPIKITRDFERVQARFHALPKAKTMAQIEKDAQAGKGTEGSNNTPNPTANGRYSNSVRFPSSRVRAYTGLSWLRVNVPSNWLDFPSQDDVQFSPQGAYGDQGITRGAMIGIYNGRNNNLTNDSEAYVNSMLQGNPYLTQRGDLVQTYVAGRQGLTTILSGRSPVTNRTEVVTIYTTTLRNGGLLYVATVVPQAESASYSAAFRAMLNSMRLND